MAVSMSIGPGGQQPPTTSYSYDAGTVALSARPATVRSAAELKGIVRTIGIFKSAVLNGEDVQIAPPSPPVVYRFLVEEETPGIYTCRFRCPSSQPGQTLTVDAVQDLATRVTSFEARPERVITWSDFDLFFRWMSLLSALAER